MTQRDDGGDELPWDRSKPDPDDLDLFAGLEPDAGCGRNSCGECYPDEQDRLTLARIAAGPILEEPPPGSE